jgi:ADP-ribosylglycohydrolase
LAYGDALGAPTEFLSVAAIVDRYGPGGPSDLTGDPALVTDDTQMTIAVADALYTASQDGPLSPERVEPLLRDRFVRWWSSPENNRAPGATCMHACEQLSTGVPWQQATGMPSKGCGANMRVAPVGLLPGIGNSELAALAQFQAALTHGHPTGLAASELTAFTVRWLRDGMAPTDLPAALRDRCASQRTTYREDWLGDLWRHDPQRTSPTDFIALGWDECVAALDDLDAALASPDRDRDPCLVTGEGWVAEEALVTALQCFLLFPDEPVSALTRGAVTSGDSDSIACLAGAFAGAAHGFDVWPSEWADRIEYRTDLDRFGKAWDQELPTRH